MNIVLDEAFEEKDGGEKAAIGMVVCTCCFLWVSVADRSG